VTSTDVLPAWADAFAPDRLGRAPRLDLPVDLTREWAFGSGTGAGVRVAVIDSGIDGDHPAVGGVDGHVVVEYDPDAEAEGFVRLVEGVHGDLYGHGNACAAIIRALAPEIELYSVRVLGERLTGKARCFAAGLDWAIAHGMHVVNMSLSTTNDDWFDRFHELADQALHKRIMVVCALSNEAKLSIPAEFASVFSVAAVTTDDPELLLANPAPPAEWGARGIDVPVAWLDGSTIVATGNSFAAPHVAGMLARMLGEHPGLTCWQAKTILAQLADNRD
jgi:subtilisin family serine protease